MGTLFKIFSALQLIRPLNCLITFLVIFVGYFSAVEYKIDGEQYFIDLITLCLVGFLITGLGNIHNDIMDVASDRVNHPSRGLVTGEVQMPEARILFFFIAILAMVLAHSVGNLFLIGASAVMILLLLYNSVLKQSVLIGNVVIALLGGFSFVYGALLCQKWQLALIPGLFAFLIHFAREIIKDLQDRAGDESAGIKTIPIVYGEKISCHVVSGILLLLLACTFVPYALKIYNYYYLLLAVVCVDLPILVMIVLLRRLKKERYHFWSIYLKGIMVFGLISVFIGRLELPV